MPKAFLRRVRTGAAIFARAPLPRLVETLTFLVSELLTNAWERALDWREAREADLKRRPKAVADFALIFVLSVALAWCANRESL